MALLALQKVLLSFVLLFGCVAGPDEFTLGGGHTFMGDSSLEGWRMTNDDSDTVFASFTWKLGPPPKVEVVNPAVPAVRWVPQPVAQEPAPGGMTDAERAEAIRKIEENTQDAAEAAGQISDAVEGFNALDWLTRVLLFLTVAWLGWVYRAQLGRLIPGSGKGNGGSAAAGDQHAKKPKTK